MMIIIFVFYHDGITALLLLKDELVASNKGHLAFENALTILFAVFNDQKLLKLQIKFGISVVHDDSSNTIILSAIDFSVNSCLLFLVHLSSYRAPLWIVITKERLSKHFDIEEVFIRTIFLKQLQF